MSFTDSIMIASSPAPLFLAQNLAQRSNAARLSSPIFPSPSQFFATKQLSLESDERVVSNSKSGVNRLTDGLTLPDQAPPSLQLRKSLMEDRENAKEIEISQGSILQSTKSKTSAVKKKEGSIDRRKKKVPKKKPEKSVENDVIVLEDDGSQRSAQQSKNSKNSNVEVQSKMKKGKITKPGVIGDLVVKKRKSISSAENVDQDDQISSEIPLKKKTKKITATKEPLDLQLAKSIKRRKDWTPTKDTPVQDVLVENLSSVSGETLSSDRSVILNQPTSGFDNLLNEFGYAKTSEEMSLNVESIEPMNNDALTKGHKIELIDLAPSVSSARSKKPKSPKKRPQTVTAKATAPFVSENSAANSLLQYFESATNGESGRVQITDETDAGLSIKSRQRKHRANATGNPGSTKSKKKTKPVPVLHSPETAIKCTEDQELIFGTSSQLARDESPTLMRDIQQAIKASEFMGKKSTMALDGDVPIALPLGTPKAACVAPVTASKNLWSVAARGLDGALLNAEVIDLVDTPKPLKACSVISKSGFLATTVSSKLGLSRLDSSIDRNPSDPSTRPEAETNPDQVLTPETCDSVAQHHFPRSIAEASLRQRRKSRSPVKMHKLPNSLNTNAHEPISNQMPNYRGFTTADLGKEVASYGFKAIKRRTEMIALLERCWESQARIALQTLPSQVALPQLPENAAIHETCKTLHPSKKKGRPPKSNNPRGADGTTTTIHDSSPKKRRGRPLKITPATSNQPPQTPSPIPSLKHPAIHPPSPTTQSLPPYGSPLSPAPTLFSQITRAISTFPPTHSVQNPTFHERILLYEPIVLEDLTCWLNTVGLSRVGVDEEIPPKVVKEWCERGGVCCFWGEYGWRAKR